MRGLRIHSAPLHCGAAPAESHAHKVLLHIARRACRVGNLEQAVGARALPPPLPQLVARVSTPVCASGVHIDVFRAVVVVARTHGGHFMSVSRLANYHTHTAGASPQKQCSHPDIQRHRHTHHVFFVRECVAEAAVSIVNEAMHDGATWWNVYHYITQHNSGFINRF